MKKIFLLAVASLSLAACDNNDDNPETSQVAARITATIGESTLSRASDTSWSKDDKIGISSTVYGEVGPYINLEYSTNGDGNFSGKTPLFYYKPMTLTAYYPFTGEEGKLTGTKYDGIIEASTEGIKQTAEEQAKFDFLWDSRTNEELKDFSAADPKVNFTFEHKMSKVSFTFISSAPVYKTINGKEVMISKGVNVEDMKSYEIDQLALEGTFNTMTGICAPNDNATVQTLTIPVEDIKAEDKKAVVAPLILFPQTLKDGKVTLRITTNELINKVDEIYGDQSYTCSLSFSNGVIKPGHHYNYSIQVTKHGLLLEKLEIVKWNDQPERLLTATIDGDPEFGNSKNNENSTN